MSTAQKYQKWKKDLHNNLENKKLQERVVDSEEAPKILENL
jgi:hypothetical protein